MRLDTTKARNLQGVKAVLTYDDPEVATLKPTTHGWTDGTNTVTYDRIMFKFFDRRVLSDYVCWVGDEAGVVVAAESERIAEEAHQVSGRRMGSVALRPRSSRGDETRRTDCPS